MVTVQVILLNNTGRLNITVKLLKMTLNMEKPILNPHYLINCFSGLSPPFNKKNCALLKRLLFHCKRGGLIKGYYCNTTKIQLGLKKKRCTIFTLAIPIELEFNSGYP
jgi:hypothetical protein